MTLYFSWAYCSQPFWPVISVLLTQICTLVSEVADELFDTARPIYWVCESFEFCWGGRTMNLWELLNYYWIFEFLNCYWITEILNMNFYAWISRILNFWNVLLLRLLRTSFILLLQQTFLFWGTSYPFWGHKSRSSTLSRSAPLANLTDDPSIILIM